MTNQSDNVDFCSIAMKAFGFLADNYGFSATATHRNEVRFIKGDIAVEVLQEPMSYMIYVQVSRASTGETFVLHEILKALAPGKHHTSQCSGNNNSSIFNCLDALANTCKNNLHDILAGKESVFQIVSASAKSDRQRFTLECQYGPMRDRANLAWDRKDWNTARQLYEESLPILSSTEKHRLNLLNRDGFRRK